ncbi:MAG: hypothetical protein HYR48_03900 [Gemmatimonadetes bacterium]|nr:hypothetical protein [Gemmatimonadota bacterium]
MGTAQRNPGTNLSVDVRVSAIVMRGDTSRIVYTLRNSLDSREELAVFTIDAPTSVLRVETPEPSASWLVFSHYRARSAAVWTMLGTHLAPGSTTPDLAMEARGLPGIVDYWAQGYFPPPPLTDADTNPNPPVSDPLRDNSIRGRTVGVVAAPPGMRPSDLLARLRELLQESCSTLAWVTSQGICRSLDAKLANAAVAVREARFSAGSREIRSFLQELEAQHGTVPGKHVNDNAYWLLRANASVVLTNMPR